MWAYPVAVPAQARSPPAQDRGSGHTSSSSWVRVASSRAKRGPVELPVLVQIPHAPAMFVVTEAEAAAIRAVFEQRGEFAAAIELRRLFPGITDNAQARECARTIAGWKPLRPVKRLPKPPRLRRVR